MLTSVLPAIGTFAVTNVDDIVLLALFYSRARRPADQRNIVIGQYAGFGAILAISILATVGLSVVSEDQIAYLGLLPIVLGLRAAVLAYRARGEAEDEEALPHALSAGAIAGLTLANGGDNIGVYVPVFSSISAGEVVTYVVVFLVLVAAWCLAGRILATRPLIARGLARWGHVALPVVLVTIGLVILVEGHAFGL